MKSKTLYVSSILLLCLVSYQNCSLVGSSHIGETEFSSMGKSCTALIEYTYQQTYYPHFRAQCTSCHDSGGRGRIFFASSDASVASQAFMFAGREKIKTMMLTEGHQGNPYNGPSQQAFINKHEATWTMVEKSVQDCAVGNVVQTKSKNTPTGNAINADNGDANNKQWRRLEWDLFTETANPEMAGKVHLIVGVQYRELVLAGVTEGYEFRRPVARIRAGAPAGTAYTVDNITVYRNNSVLANATAYQAVLATISTATDSPLIAGGNSPAPVAIMNYATDLFALRFAEIRDPAGNPVIVVDPGGGGGGGGGTPVPARVTYADLMNAASPLGVFARSCVGCHNANNPSGALNLAAYASAQASAASIRSRSRNPMRPMPTNGLLPQFEQDVIAKWADIGAPQN